MNRTQGTSQQEDAALIGEFLSGKRESFDRLVLKYRDMVFNLCFRILGEYDEANDCAQEVFLRVHGNLKNFRFDAAFPTWLYRITVNTTRNFFASAAYRRRKAAENIDEIELAQYSARLAETPDSVLEQKERERIIQNAISALPGMQKAIIVLRDIEGKSYEEIALITGRKIGTVKSTLARARETLREKLEGLLYNGM
jgi:RNA polymerase sigma-70 factor, ECF subfamily